MDRRNTMAKQSKQERARKYADGAREAVRRAYIAVSRHEAKLIVMRESADKCIADLQADKAQVDATVEAARIVDADIAVMLKTAQEVAASVFALKLGTNSISAVIAATAEGLGMDLSKIAVPPEAAPGESLAAVASDLEAASVAAVTED